MHSSQDRKKIAVFRCDASSEIGAGHIVRSSSLAAQMRTIGWQTHLITGEDSLPFLAICGDVYDYIHSLNGKGTCTVETAQILQNLQQPVGVFVLDHYDFSHIDEETISGYTENLMVIEDLPNRYHRADILLDTTAGRKEEDYHQLISSDCRMLLGPHYALLRAEFIQNRAIPRQANDRIRFDGTIFVSLGATDPYNLTPQIVSLLHDYFPNHLIDVCIGKMAPGVQKLESLARSTNQIRLNLDSTASQIVKAIEQASIGIGAAGSSSWERCCMALPSIAFVMVDNQAHIAKALAEHHAAIVLDPHKYADGFISAVTGLLNDGENYAGMSANSIDLCDGLGCVRVSEVISGM